MAVNGNGTFMEEKDEIESRLLASPRADGSWSITDPSGGDVYTFNPNTATFGQMADFLATLAKLVVGE